MQINKTRYSYLDVLRIMAICLVVFTHSGNFGIHSYLSEGLPIAKKLIYVFLAPFSQISVPLFFMITGALLFGKTESISRVWKHRIPRIAGAAIFAIALQDVVVLITLKRPLSVMELIKSFYLGGNLTQQWFLYSYLSILLILPLLQKLACQMTEKEFHYIFLLELVLGILVPMWDAVFDWGTPKIQLLLFAECLYPFMGYYLHTYKLGKKSKFTAEIALGVIVLLGIFNTAINYHSLVLGGKLAYINLFTPIYAYSVFRIVQCIHTQREGNWAGILQFASNGVFGAYLLEYTVEIILQPVAFAVFGETGNILGLLVWIVCIVTIGILISNVLRKIPIFGKIF